jgi:membrane fusion protein (multidrug efflux system)
LLANESVTLVSELSRRLTRVRVEEGAEVKRGALLFELDASDLVAQRARVQAQHRLAQRTAERQDALRKENLVSEQEWDSARARVEELDAQLRELDVTLSKTRITAPFAGRVGVRQVSEGAWLTPQTPLASLYDVKKLKLDFQLPERFVAQARVGSVFRFRVDGRDETFEGRIVAVEPRIEATTRSVLVRGLVEDPKDLTPGTFAKVTLPTGKVRAIFVPTAAVVLEGGSHRVFVASATGAAGAMTAKAVPVQLGVRTADRAEVVSGLAEGERVIVSNVLRLRPGAPVSVSRESAAAPAASGVR